MTNGSTRRTTVPLGPPGLLILRVLLVFLGLPAFGPAVASAQAPPQAPGGSTSPVPAHAAQAQPQFPQDEGAHPAWKTEWWYVTGWLRGDDGQARGFQITFFRNLGPAPASSLSAFAPRQLMVAHVALSDPATGALQHDERVARASFDLAGADAGHLNVHLRDWRLQRRDAHTLEAEAAAQRFALRLVLHDTQAPLLQGEQGRSQKGPDARAFSWYYSLPHLTVSGTLALAASVGTGAAAPQAVTGEAWLDHEWSDAYVSPGAVGWDWTGLNFDDGSALMAFRMRRADGSAVWAGGTWRDASGLAHRLAPGDVQFTPGRPWLSPVTGARYPVTWTLRWPGHEVHLQPLLDNQEMDTRNSTGTAYWEGAVQAQDADGKSRAHGYLELTGYWKPLQF